MKRKLSAKDLISRGVMELYHNLSLDQYTGDSEALSLVKDYIKNISKFREGGLGICAYGPPGTGKTFLMCEVLKEALRTQKPNGCYYEVRKTSLGEIVHNFTNTWYDRASIANFQKSLLVTDFLLIDDVEKVYVSEGSKNLIVAALDKVIRTRVERKRPILITTNETPLALATMFGEPIASLLSGHCRTIKFKGNDYRREERAADKWQRVMGGHSV